jgi:hypothetical protein
VGARITVSGGPVEQSQQIVAGGRYCSSDEPQRTFATGNARALAVRVRWRSGRETLITNLAPNCIVEVSEIATAERADPGRSPRGRIANTGSTSATTGPAIRFVDDSRLLGHLHQELPFDDFERQPLLPRKLSQLGPGLAWWDLDGDGWDDLAIGGGRGGHPGLYRNNHRGGFDRVETSEWIRPLERDWAGMAGIAPRTLLVASSNYEDGETNEPGVSEWTALGSRAVLPLGLQTFGPLAVADYDGDGALDLFVGGRVEGGRYPVNVASSLFRRQGDAFEPDEQGTKALPGALASGATWTDLSGDGWPELVMACEWGALCIMTNDQGRLHAWDPPLAWSAGAEGRGLERLSQLTGWWTGVAAGDLDSDGRLDLIAANWGCNTRYEHWRPGPLRVYFGDFNDDGNTVLFETHWVAPLNRFAPDRMLDSAARGFPRLNERFPTHAAWSAAGIAELLGESQPAADFHEAVWLESTLLLNRGDHFEAAPLPLEAQFSPAFGVCIGDADGDGNEDVFLSQNFFAVATGTPRSDAGRGVWLRGNGRGALAAVAGQDSGVCVYGEQRGAALADYDQDGRVDLAVAQNGAETRLLRNVGAARGLRIRLQGAANNPQAIGAVVRLRFGNRYGPARELHAGSGYWSQDSPVLVLSTPARADAVQVRWPGGCVTEGPLNAGAREIVVQMDGEINEVTP